MKLLIVGIPGTGKTTIGNYLRDKRSFVHIDMESENNIPEAFENPENFVKRLEDISGDLVVTWGFVPIELFIDLINKLKDIGYKVVWFDGSREFSKKAFIERNSQHGEEFLSKSMDDLHVQMARINETDVIKKINPIIVDTFDSKGVFRSYEDIIKDVLN